jgi:hypothetical protein
MVKVELVGMEMMLSVSELERGKGNVHCLVVNQIGWLSVRVVGS